MNLLSRMFGTGEPAIAEPAPLLDPATSARTPREKIEFHCKRFARALEQCEKPDKRAELQRNLDYWRERLAAEQRLEGVID